MKITLNKKILDENFQLPSDKKFGFFFTIVFLITSIYLYSKSYTYILYFFIALTIIFFFTTIIEARIFRPLNRLWMSFGLILGLIISPIVMGFIFFFIFTPVGIMMRMFGRDELRLIIKKQPSYWIRRKKDSQSNSFYYQF